MYAAASWREVRAVAVSLVTTEVMGTLVVATENLLTGSMWSLKAKIRTSENIPVRAAHCDVVPAWDQESKTVLIIPPADDATLPDKRKAKV